MVVVVAVVGEGDARAPAAPTIDHRHHRLLAAPPPGLSALMFTCRHRLHQDYRLNVFSALKSTTCAVLPLGWPCGSNDCLRHCEHYHSIYREFCSKTLFLAKHLSQDDLMYLQLKKSHLVYNVNA